MYSCKLLLVGNCFARGATLLRRPCFSDSINTSIVFPFYDICGTGCHSSQCLSGSVEACLPYEVLGGSVEVCLPYDVLSGSVEACLPYEVFSGSVEACLPYEVLSGLVEACLT